MTREIPHDLDVDYELTRFVRRVRTRGMSRLGEIHPQLDYGAFLFLIAICDATDGIRGSELAEQLGVHKSTASRAVSTLDSLGLVQRVADPDDGRAQRLIPEPDALARVAAFRQRSHVWLSEILSGWNEAEITAFAGSLARLNDAADQIP